MEARVVRRAAGQMDVDMDAAASFGSGHRWSDKNRNGMNVAAVEVIIGV